MAISPEDKEAERRHIIRYRTCIYITGILGAVSQIVAIIVIIGHLFAGLNIQDLELEHSAKTYSALATTLLIGQTFSEILLLRAIDQGKLPYIQWWMMSTSIILIFSLLMAVIVGFTLYNDALWTTLSFVYLVIRLPFQMYFVDKFTHLEIVQKQAHPHSIYESVLYHRFS